MKAWPKHFDSIRRPSFQDGNGDLFSLSIPSKREWKAAPNTPSQAKRSPQKTKRIPPSPQVKQGEGARFHHQMSGESSGEEEENTPQTDTATKSATNAAAAAALSHSSTFHPAGNQISDSEEEEGEKGSGTAAKPPCTIVPVTSSSQAPGPSPALPRPSCQYGARCYR